MKYATWKMFTSFSTWHSRWCFLRQFKNFNFFFFYLRSSELLGVQSKKISRHWAQLSSRELPELVISCKFWNLQTYTWLATFVMMIANVPNDSKRGRDQKFKWQPKKSFPNINKYSILKEKPLTAIQKWTSCFPFETSSCIGSS